MARQEREPSQATKARIPRFKSLVEAAQFWDTHDSADYEEEFQDVDDDIRFLVVRGQPKKAISVRLPEDVIADLTKQAQAAGVGLSTLIRMWVLERLRESKRSSRPA